MLNNFVQTNANYVIFVNLACVTLDMLNQNTAHEILDSDSDDEGVNGLFETNPKHDYFLIYLLLDRERSDCRYFRQKR